MWLQAQYKIWYVAQDSKVDWKFDGKNGTWTQSSFGDRFQNSLKSEYFSFLKIFFGGYLVYFFLANYKCFTLGMTKEIPTLHYLIKEDYPDKR